MEKKRIVPIWASAVLTILCVAGIVFNVYDMTILVKDQPGSILLDVLICLLYVSALVYCFMRYKKKAAVFFKAVCVLAVLVMIFFLYDVATNFDFVATNSIIFISSLLTFGGWCIVAFVSNLGKKQSLITAWVILVTTIVTSSFSGDSYILIKTLFQVAVCVVFLIMVYAKYADKAARGAI